MQSPQTTRNRRVIYGATLTALLALGIAALTLAPISFGTGSNPDKLYHFIAFACLAFPLSFALPGSTLWIALAVIIYGGAIELIQPYFGRQTEWADFLADTIGAMVGSACGAILGFRHR